MADVEQDKNVGNNSKLERDKEVIPEPQSREPGLSLTNRYSPELLARLGSLTSDVATVEWHHPSQEGEVQTVLVNIEQYHDSEGLEEKVGVEVADKAEKVQAQIAEILEAMKVDEIRLDGMSPEIAANYAERVTYLKQVGEQVEPLLEANPALKDPEAVTSLLRQRVMRQLSPDQVEVLEIVQRYQEVKVGMVEEAKYNKFVERAIDGKLRFSAGEDAELLESSLGLMKEDPCIEFDHPQFKDISDKREQHLVNQVGESGQKVDFVSMGSGHSLKEEVDTWNQQNPEKLITLVRVTPTATQIEAELKSGEEIHCE